MRNGAMYNAIDAQLDYLDSNRQFRREVSCFALPEYGIISATTNHSAGSVEFDWFAIKDHIWSLKERPNIAYMLHTHPMGMNRMSSTDRNMVQGWCLALWIPIWFLVVTEEEIAYYLCSVNKDKKVDIDLLDLSVYNTKETSVELEVVARTMYGISKAQNDLSKESFDGIFSMLKEADLSWNGLHEWNEHRKWNQVSYNESGNDNEKNS